MDVYILDKDYNKIGMIGDAESVLWNKKYNDIGECEIYVPCNDEYLALLRCGNYVYRYDDDMMCRIEKVQIEQKVEEGDHIIATGKDICTMFSGRIVRWQIVYSGTVGGFIKKLINDNVINPAQAHRKIPRVLFDESNLGEFREKIEASAFTEDLLNTVMTTCKSFNIGFRLSFDAEDGQIVFALYRGKNKTSTSGGEYIEFSPEFANIIRSNYSEDDSEYKNVVYVGYKSANKDDETVYLLSYPDNENQVQGADRREVYVDGTGTSRDITFDELKQMFGDVQRIESAYYATIDKEFIAVAMIEGEGDDEKLSVTDTAYLMLIRILAQNTLAEQTRSQIFEGEVDTIDTYRYRDDYDIGDIVKVKNEYGIEAEARIVEVMESDDSEGGYVVEPKFEYIN